MSDSAILRTPLHSLHIELGARMAPFAGYDMPIQYRAGILAEHLQTRARAGLFDVSHMGQARLEGPDHAATARALERLCPADILGLAEGRQRYTQFLNAEGGVIDDLMVSRPPGADGELRLVVNAARKGVDYDLLETALPAEVRLTRLDDAALIAVQGPAAAAALARVAGSDALAAMPFMGVRAIRFGRFETQVSRSGYTGEDGFEISLPAAQAEAFARRLLEEDEIEPVGLGARDSLRLEAGLCLYGHELDEATDPIEAGLAWSIQKRRRLEGGFPGAPRVQAALAQGPTRRRIGLRLMGRAIAREGAEIIDGAGQPIGRITSGGFGPSVGAPIAMGYVAHGLGPDAPLALLVRGKPLEARRAPLPFHPHAYHRG
jgi:aminomethyltransferase